MNVSSLRGSREPLETAQGWREQLSLVLVVTRREIRDTLRDWRLVVPIVMLTLVFPLILNLAAKLMLDFVRRYNATVAGEQAVPFLLLVVGFFPISFSLVIALETFVGEKERKSLEPLLATPLSDTQLYLGKTLAAVIPPLLASCLGIGVYLGSLFLTIDYRLPLVLVLQILLLTMVEALVMVSGAVIVSSQTTSVRAANLLASFIILPMAFLVQGEALILFWSRQDLLWFILMALIVSELILVRMGIRIFSREELLGCEIDRLNLRQSWGWFKQHLLGLPKANAPGVGSTAKPGIIRFYRHDVPRLLYLSRPALGVVFLCMGAALLIGWHYAVRHPFPAGAFTIEDISHETFDQFKDVSFLPALSTWGILSHNVRSLLLAGLLATVSFGSIAVVLLMAPVAIIAFLTAQAAMAGYNPLVFVGVFILPHGIIELPAAIVATAMALRLGMSVVSPPTGMTVGQSLLQALAYLVKTFVLVVLPLLVIAAFIEAHITPQIVIAVYGS